MAPRAHLAIYKVSFKKGKKSTAESSDTLKGIDEAIRDHVDILSMSLGSGPKPLYEDSIAIGSFAAMKTGIVPVAAAGNNGTFKSMLSNDAPWILTVGASTTDRRMRAVVKLGNGEKYYGESAYQPDTSDTQLPLVYPGVKKTQETLSCQAGSMQGFDVKGKIVLCGTGHTDNTEKGEVVKKAGGAGMIVMNQPWQGNTTNADAHVIPTSHVSFKDAWDILTYFESTANPTASITFEGTKVVAPLSPAVSDFSSRGPSLINGGIIKPDIVAPRVNVLAAWPFQLGPNPSPTTPTSKTFRFASGTSMATPHVAGIVALLKNSHPKRSPAAIKSALMTTAYVKDREGKPIADQADGVAPHSPWAPGISTQWQPMILASSMISNTTTMSTTCVALDTLTNKSQPLSAALNSAPR
ncbi:hypothetical protein J5N97_003324 [Dioscorea zingiberensis]|uniref:Uncharacterized protein n=1 Tax=Dioscorea zingiberensis TaxID=325984 RepID=A0A9D5D6F5_9LILI|nr:hypothetical protein J5N97_003324 [Dioscorea zingiberensis]